MHTVRAVRKNVIFSEDLISEAKSLAEELDMDFSKLIRNALLAYINLVKRERVSRELEAEALANRDFYRAISKEFETIGLETWL